MPKLPRDLSGAQLIRALQNWGTHPQDILADVAQAQALSRDALLLQIFG